MDSAAAWRSFKAFIADDSMSIALFGLFLLCIAGQGLSGWFSYDQSLREAHFPEIGLAAYLATGDFLDGALSNWQAAILQLAVLVVLSSVLRQKGAAHSRKEDGYRTLNLNITARPTATGWLYANSLSLAFIALFAATFLLHLRFGEWKYNEDQALRRLAAISIGEYAVSSSFWFSVFQCWEAEFAAIGLYISLSIFLRQEGSPESKPVGASDWQTGEHNE